MKKLVFIFVALLCASLMEAKVTLPQLFQSGMVLQRGKVIPVWGKADAGEVVTIQFNKNSTPSQLMRKENGASICPK